MRCPGCRKAIPVEALKHEECGWNVSRGNETVQHETQGPRASPEVAGRYVRDMKRRNAAPKIYGVRYWQEFLKRESLTPFQIKFAEGALHALRFSREPGQDEEELAA